MTNSHKILNLTATHFGITPDVILSRNRTPQIADARAVSMTLMFETGMHPEEIGATLRRDRSSINHAMKKVQNLSEVYPSFALTLSTLRKKLKGKEE